MRKAGFAGENPDRVDHDAFYLRCALEERVKELNCLYGISEIVEREGGSLPAILQGIANLLPTSWEYPSITCARIALKGTEFKSDNYSDSPWKQVAELRVHGEPAGFVEVSYLEERPQRGEGPFLLEERTLINAVAERTGRIVERLRANQFHQQREAELRNRLAHLTRVATMGEMASSIAHEVNQPLTAIATYTQACTRMMRAGTTDTEEILEILSRVTDEALRAGGIVHRLKDLMRRREGKRTECDVNSLIRDLEHLVSVDTRLHDVQLDLQLSESLPLVLVDSIQIQQVVLNLIRNAVDAMMDCVPEKREIVVRTVLRKGGKVEISVADTGCGLSPECEEEMFQPFFTTKEDGMGMGLSVSRSIVTSHGGQMWFSHNQDAGTTFHVTIPYIAENDDG